MVLEAQGSREPHPLPHAEKHSCLKTYSDPCLNPRPASASPYAPSLPPLVQPNKIAVMEIPSHQPRHPRHNFLYLQSAILSPLFCGGKPHKSTKALGRSEKASLENMVVDAGTLLG
ncbi:hypothetical protein J4Q44_G00334230 [Coregonus suidteri]|uniref:Uncharacterized protein n=1 Tax=Coregonus suidteri TaxID=861788 RepID=A0AAN8KUQ9_9TELE